MNPSAEPFYPTYDDEEPKPICQSYEPKPESECSSNIEDIITGSETKKVQEEKKVIKASNHNTSIERFRVATDRYYERILAEAVKAIENATSTSHTYAILDCNILSESEDCFNSTMMMYGFWDNKNYMYNTAVFINNHIEMPFIRAVKELESHGYRLTDVSDPKKSRKIFLKLSW